MNILIYFGVFLICTDVESSYYYYTYPPQPYVELSPYFLQPEPLNTHNNFEQYFQTPVDDNVTAGEDPDQINDQQNQDYRGFAYRTQFESGGHSNVVFLIGTNFNKVLISTPREGKNLNELAETARTVASNSLDANSIQENKDDAAFTTVLQLLGARETAIRSFYSGEDELFRSSMRPLNPLQLPSRSRGDEFQGTTEAQNATEDTTETTTEIALTTLTDIVSNATEELTSSTIKPNDDQKTENVTTVKTPA